MPLLLKPNCEYCDQDLPPDAEDARICSYECTFCLSCVESKLQNVCPNCGGGFVSRPIRPSTEWRKGVSLGNQPASTVRVHVSRDVEEIEQFVKRVQHIAPQDR